MQKRFSDDFRIASPDFQDVHGYPKEPFTDEVLTMGSPHVTHRFGCLSQTGWDGARSARLGEVVLQPVLQSIRAMK